MSATTAASPKAVIFDAYGTLFDVHSVVAAAEQMFPGHGEPLSQLWRLKQIEYTQLRTLAAPTDRPGAHYRPFWDITLDALRFAARKLQLTLGSAAEKRLMDEYACLSAFPDVQPALRTLRDAAPGRPARADAADAADDRPAARVGLAILSNGNPQMLDIALKSAGLVGLFDHVLSVDAVRAYKPSPATYALGPQAFDAQAREIVFVSANGWDVAGAAWFGFTTFWLNRSNAPVEELGVTPDATGSDLNGLLGFLQTLAPGGFRSGVNGGRTSANTNTSRVAKPAKPARKRPGPGA